MWMLQAQCRRQRLGVVGVGGVVGVADLEITLILGGVGRCAQACSLVVLVTAAEGHAGERVHAGSLRKPPRASALVARGGDLVTRYIPPGGGGLFSVRFRKLVCGVGVMRRTQSPHH